MKVATVFSAALAMTATLPGLHDAAAQESVAAQIARENLQAVVTLVALDDHDQPLALGSGFFITRDGALATNAHVVDGAVKIHERWRGRAGPAVRILNVARKTDLPTVTTSIGSAPAESLDDADQGAIARFEIRGSASDPASALSGGNQQKLCVARALRAEPGVLVVVNPTRGLDVHATAAVRDELRAQARAGTAVLVISTELDEVLELGQRISVLFRGRLIDVPEGERTREAIGRRMLGESAGE